jgi:virulence factor Mce-like protein
MEIMKKLLVPLVIGALVVAAALTMFRGGSDQKTLVAHFPRTISIYEGSEVRVLGVPVGEIEQVTPSGTDVEVRMVYDAEVKIPADAKAVIIAPSIVGDRFVQLTPAYSGGEVLSDAVELSVDQTSVPLELDQIYESLDQLNVALGPNGANKDGALSDLLAQTARNFGGQGESFNQTITNFAKLSATLDNNKEELFGSAAQLQKFVSTLAENDQTVRRFNQSLADVSELLAGERQELTSSLDNLSVAMTEVSSFVRDNKDSLGRNIKGLNRVSKVLVKQRDALDEVLQAGPLALNNLALTYNPQAGTLDTRANLPAENIHQITADPATFLCGFVRQAEGSGPLCDTIKESVAAGARRAPALGGGVARELERFDPTLGGLVEVQR